MPKRFLLTADLPPEGGADRALRRSHAAGESERIRPGVYLPSDVWSRLDDRWRHIAAITALSKKVTSPVIVSHGSAAALWDFPVLDGWPDVVHVLDPGRRTAKRTANVFRHALCGAVPVTRRHGIVCTGAVRTAVDVALSDGYLPGLLAFDRGLRQKLFSPEELDAELAGRRGSAGIRAAREAAAIASPLSESAAESISKGEIARLGFALPVQQQIFPRPGGRHHVVDFWWSEQGIIGEFDGREKYLDPAKRNGRSLEDVLLAEKDRADELFARPEVKNLVRWKYAVARDPVRLAAVLEAAGVPRLSAVHPQSDTRRNGTSPVGQN